MDERQKRGESVSSRFLSRLLPRREEGQGALAVLTAPLFCLIAALFARTHIVFGTYPLAFALLAVIRLNPLPILIGACVGALTLGGDGYVYLLAYLLLVGLRALFSHPRREGERYFDELPQLQITAAILSGVCLAAWQLVRQGLTTYALLYAAAAIVAPAVSAALLMGVFAAELRLEDFLGTRHYREGELAYAGMSPLYVQVGVLTLFCALAYALCEFHLFGLSLGYSAAALFTLFAARRRGALLGCVAGLFMALSVLPLYAPAFAILGLFSGALFPRGTGYALVLGVGGAGVAASYFGGAVGLLTVVPEMCITALLSWPLYMKMTRQAATEDGSADRAGERAVTYVAEGVMRRTRDEGAYLHHLSNALLAVSDSFRSEGQKEEKPDIADYFMLCDRVCNQFCPDCKNRALCFEGGRAGVAAIGRIAEQLSHSGTLRVGEESYFPSYCPSEERILRAVRAEAASLCDGKRRAAHSSQIAAEYMMMSRLLAEEARTSSAEDAPDTALAARLQAKIAAAFPALSGATVLVRGKRHLCVTLGTREVRALGGAVDEIRHACESETGLLFGEGVFEEVNQVGTLRFEIRPRFCVQVFSAVASCRDGEVSGDAVTWFESNRDGFYALVSDGMGNGRRAARASRLACSFLEQMLGAGCSMSHTAEMLHHLLRGRSDESSVTLDLFYLDTLCGRGRFLKCGATSSYVKRGESFYRIRAKTPPIGILKDYAGETVEFDLQGGDIILLLSDGITPDGEEAPWLLRAFNEDLQGDLQRAANSILSLAAQKSGVEDDRSMMIIKIEDMGAENASEQSENGETKVAS